MSTQGVNLEQRVLVLAPTARDRAITCSLLADAGIDCEICEDMHSLAGKARQGAGAIMLSETSLLSTGGLELLARALAEQPSWSDLPVVLLINLEAVPSVVREVIDRLGNVVLIERPVPMRSMISAVHAAIRARKRQYQIRDQLEQIRKINEDLRTAANERRELLQREQAARAEAERVSRLKDDFLATMSHELRTPMTAIMGWAQMLQSDRADKATINEGLEVILRNARVQAKLIEDLLDISRITAGKVRLNITDVHLGDLIDAAVDAVQHSASTKQIIIQTRVFCQGTLKGDPDRLQQVIWNLLTNAVKFTPAGGTVEVTVRDQSNHVTVSVKDTGIGIRKEFLPHVFERFRQSDASTTRRHGGLGLGLGIAKQLVELHGGSIRAVSDGEGRGAEFVFTLPVSTTTDSEASARAAPVCDDASTPPCNDDLRGVHVLFVDDDADVREIVRRLLIERYATVTVHASATEALDWMNLASPSDRNLPDVLVSDIGMPDMDGYEFIERVRASLPRQEDFSAVALTAFAGRQHRDRAERAGYKAHLSKPIDVAEFVHVIRDLAGR